MRTFARHHTIFAGSTLLLVSACSGSPAPPPTVTIESASPEVLRFAALGDAGQGNRDQRLVATAMANVCERSGCDFVLSLGDNFYPAGVTSVDDPQFDEKFEQIYAELNVPFYLVLGNHDYGEWTIDRDRTAHQVAYTSHSERWNMPDRTYTLVHPLATFTALDTNALYSGALLGWAGDQKRWLERSVEAVSTPWHVVFGHHPWRSNGQHGNAGDYENWFLGGWVESTFEDTLCGRTDLYLAGHDHNLQWLAPTCDVELVVSGAGSKSVPLAHHDDTPTRWENDETPGFFWAELHRDRLVGVFFDKNGQELYRREITPRDKATNDTHTP